MKNISKQLKIETYKEVLRKLVYQGGDGYICNEVANYVLTEWEIQERDELCSRSFKEIENYKPKGAVSWDIDGDGYFENSPEGRNQRVDAVKDILLSLGVSRNEIGDLVASAS